VDRKNAKIFSLIEGENLGRIAQNFVFAFSAGFLLCSQRHYYY